MEIKRIKLVFKNIFLDIFLLAEQEKAIVNII